MHVSRRVVHDPVRDRAEGEAFAAAVPATDDEEEEEVGVLSVRRIDERLGRLSDYFDDPGADVPLGNVVAPVTRSAEVVSVYSRPSDSRP